MAVGNITGLSSGIEWADTVKLLMELERRPVNLLETRRTAYKNRLTNWSSVESKLNALKSTAEALDRPDELLSMSASTSDSAVLTAVARQGAIAGVHNILVNRVATRETIAHTAGWADMDTTQVNNSGSDKTFSYQYGSETVSVTVADGATLRDLVNLINKDENNPGVTASILNDGSGGAGAYHLVLTGNKTGEDNTITIIDTLANPTDIGNGSDFDAANWSVTQAAQNAEVRIDGFPDPGWGWPNPWIESSSNDLVDIIPGVTVNLKSDSGGSSIRVDVSLDKSAVYNSANKLVSAYNDLVGTINSLTAYNSETKTAGPLANDPFARSISRELSTFISSNIPGTTDADKYRSLGQVGIKLTSGGKLSLDRSKLESALEDDPTGVARLFAFDAISSSGYVAVNGSSPATQGGTHDFTFTYNADGSINTGGTNTIGGVDGTVHGTSMLVGKSGSAVDGLILSLSNPGDGPNSVSGTVQVYKGLASLLIEKVNLLTDSYDGRMKSARDGIDSAISTLDNRISNWEKRLEKVEENYNRRFQTMETLIGQLQSTGNYITAILGS